MEISFHVLVTSPLETRSLPARQQSHKQSPLRPQVQASRGFELDNSAMWREYFWPNQAKQQLQIPGDLHHIGEIWAIPSLKLPLFLLW